MLFNSLDFALFLPIIFAFYWFLNRSHLSIQNILLLLSSYFFYSCWDWRFLFLLLFSTLLDYVLGIVIYKESNKKIKLLWLWLSIGINIGLLVIFKYYNFFVASITDAISLLGLQSNLLTLKIVLPIGISFYTFHGLSYVIDIYKNRIQPEKNLINYSLFVSFFPLLVAGPIERATHLLPQIKRKRIFDYSKAVDGMRQILWGLFKKIVIADNCAEYVNLIFDNSSNYSGSTLLLGAIFFAIQIYGDFSGYSDIALGTARLFGIELFKNFSFPYFSRNISEFWSRWHISLSSWFKDYVYIPLGGGNNGIRLKIRNIFIIFLLSGLWHGANWTFIIWGFLNALYMVSAIILKKNKKHNEIVAKGRLFPTFYEISSIFITFLFTVFAWIFFRSNTVSHAFNIIAEIFSNSFFTLPYTTDRNIIILIFLFFTIEWMGREQQFAIANIESKCNKFIRWIFYFILIFEIYYNMINEKQFIYFQF